MPITVVSDMPAVLELASRARQEDPSMPKEQAAAFALRQFYHLCARDGIWGGSDAAVCMGFKGHDENENVFGLIATEVAAQLP